MANVTKKRIAIIGAGPSGISQLIAFKQAEQEGRVELVCFERQADWGGIWQYTALTGTDSCGEPIHSSMYRQLWSNGPKELTEFVDYRFGQHFGRSISSYPPRAVLFDYISGRAKEADIRKFIRFRTAVRHVGFDSNTQEFHVTVQDLLTNEISEDLAFDHVVVASGHYTKPNMPEFEGLSKFPGRVLHSHDYRGADDFVGKNLLVIGNSYSGEDIALQCYKFGAQSVTISYRSSPTGLQWPEKIQEVPLLERLEGNTAYFKDGTKVEGLDCVILCTGYRHNHSYMAENLRLYCSGNPYIPSNLYKGIFWAPEPRLAYLGMQNQLYTLNMFDIQAALVRDVFLGLVQLPDNNDEKVRQDEILKWQIREKSFALNDHYAFFKLQTDYLADLISSSDQKTVPGFDLKQADAIIRQFLSDKENNILTYRDQSFPSLFSPNSQASLTQVPWLCNFDDTIDGYMSCI